MSDTERMSADAERNGWRAASDPAQLSERAARTTVARDGRDDGGAAGDGAGREASGEALLAERTQEYRDRWHRVQVMFVDDPGHAVEEADHLVDDVITSIVDTLAAQRGRLESGWQQGSETTTEELRLALHRYRAFFNRLLATS